MCVRVATSYECKKVPAEYQGIHRCELRFLVDASRRPTYFTYNGVDPASRDNHSIALY